MLYKKVNKCKHKFHNNDVQNQCISFLTLQMYKEKTFHKFIYLKVRGKNS